MKHLSVISKITGLVLSNPHRALGDVSSEDGEKNCGHTRTHCYNKGLLRLGDSRASGPETNALKSAAAPARPRWFFDAGR